MIIKDDKSTHISSSSSLRKVVEYHQKKIDSGDAKLVPLGGMKLGNVLSEGTAYMEELISNRNKPALHIPISFHPDDRIDDQKIRCIVMYYLKMKNVDANQVVLIQHFDEPHPHYHLILLNKTPERKYNTSFTKFGSIKDTIAFCRQYEKALRLTQVLGDKSKVKNFNDSKAVAYSVNNAISKNYQLLLNHLGDYSILLKKLKNQDSMSNEEIKTEHEKAFFYIHKYLSDNDLLYVSRKERVSQLIKENIIEISKDPSKFEHAELYLRVIKNTYIKYGLKSTSFYVNEHKLPKQFSLKFIQGEADFTKKNSIDFVRQKLNIVLSTCISIPDLAGKLSKYDITIRAFSNSSGPYGMSFIHKENELKASEVGKGFSYSKIDTYFKEKAEKSANLSNGLTSNFPNSSPLSQVNDVQLKSSSEDPLMENNGTMNSDIDDIIKPKKKGMRL